LARPLTSCADHTYYRATKAQESINIIEQPFHIEKRLKFPYVKATLSTRQQTLKAYHQGHLIKALPYKLAIQ
jgi:hypothetical protein